MVDGSWYNQHNDLLILETDGNALSGTYRPSALTINFPFELVGKLEITPGKDFCAIGFTITWAVEVDKGFMNSHTLTTWCGQYHDGKEEERICLAWIKTRLEVPDVEFVGDKVWKMAMGHDIFRRDKSDDRVLAPRSYPLTF
jgi:hypothetical protein